MLLTKRELDGIQDTMAKRIKSEVECTSLPKLYMNNKLGKEMLWETYVLGNKVFKIHGQIDGKMKDPVVREIAGKSQGKKNQISDEEQAIRVAERDWIAQLDKGYRPKCKKGKELVKKILQAKKAQGNINVGLDVIIRGREADKICTNASDGVVLGLETNYETMQCAKWEDEAKCHKYFDFDKGVYVQPKLDGIRCLAFRGPGGQIILLSRGENQFGFLNHIREQIDLLIQDENIILDGEVYASKIYADVVLKGKKKTYIPSENELPIEDKFNVITGACRTNRSSPHELESQLEYHVFDILDPTGTRDQKSRFIQLKKLFSNSEVTHIKKVPTFKIYNVNKIDTYHVKFAKQNFEGIIIRSSDCKYEMKKRSLRIRKYKNFEDAEFLCIGVERDKGVGQEYITWKCQDLQDPSIVFSATPRGTREQKIEWYNNRRKYVNKCNVTVKFQGLSDKGIPRFPIGIAIRDYE